VLARLYRKAGRAEEARAIDDELRGLLAVADADHPVLVALKMPALIGATQPSRIGRERTERRG